MPEDPQYPPPDCFVPLYKLTPCNPDGPYRQHGTGFLLFYRETPFLVTAAHVVEDAQDGISVFLPTTNEVRRLTDRFVMTPIPDGGRRNDFLDLAVLGLEREFAENITRAGQGFWPISERDVGPWPPGPRLRFCGYPGRAPNNIQNRPIHMAEGAQIILQPFVQSLPTLPQEELPPGIPHEHCFAGGPMNFEAEPGGMSGGPVFIGDRPDVKLVGVTTNYVERGSLLLGTGMIELLNLLERSLE